MRLVYKDEALKQLKRIGERDRSKVKKKIELVKTNPLLGKQLQGEYQGLRCLRAWPLRIFYNFDSRLQEIEIISVKYRGGAYK